MKKPNTFLGGISAFFADSSSFMTFVGKIALAAVLNLCLLACGLPVVTLGAASAALYAALLDRASLTYVSAFTAFFRGFRRHWRTATAVWLPAMALGGLLVWNLTAAWSRTEQPLLLTPLLLAASLWAITLEWLFPVLAATGCTARAGVKTAFLLGLRELWRSFLLLALDAAPVTLCLLYAQTFMALWGFWSLLGFALIALVKCRLMEPVLKGLTPLE